MTLPGVAGVECLFRCLDALINGPAARFDCRLQLRAKQFVCAGLCIRATRR
jgi:hypothetical protein